MFINTGNSWLTYDYIPLIHHFRLQYSDPDQVRKLTEYHSEVSECYGGPHGRNHTRYDIEREDGRVIRTDATEH